MKRPAIFTLLFLFGIASSLLISSIDAKPPNFCIRHPNNPNCVTTVNSTISSTTTTITTLSTTTLPTTDNGQYGIAVGYPGVVVNFNHGDYNGYVSHAKSLGATVLRTDYSTGAGTAFSSLYNAARSQGLEVVPIIVGKSSWTTSTASSVATDLVARYPDIRKVELGNEPNGSWSWGYTPSPIAYSELIKAMTPILRNNLPGVVLISPGLAQYNISSLSNMNAIQYETDLAKTGIDVDCWGYHPYDEWGWNTQMPQMIQALRTLGIGEPLCLTETGRNTLEFTEQQQADAVTFRITEARTRNDLSDLYWYSLQDHCSTCVTDRENKFGLFKTDWTAKLAVAAYINALK